VLPKWAWSGSREQFLHCGLRKFRHSKSSIDRWYTQLDLRRFVYDTWDYGSRLGRVMVECTLSITHCLRLNLTLHTIDLVRTCRISSFCTVAWQLARFQLTRRIARSLGDSWASCVYIPSLLFASIKCVCFSRNACISKFHYRPTGEGDLAAIWTQPRYYSNLNFYSKIWNFTAQEGTKVKLGANGRVLKNPVSLT